MFVQTGGFEPKARPVCRPTDVMKPTGDDQVLSERQMRIKMTFVRHHPDQAMRRRLQGRTLKPPDIACVGSNQTRKASQQCCLAGSVVSPQDDTFSCNDRKIDSA